MTTRTGRAIVSVAGVLLISRLLGFIREMVIADKFGTSSEYDLYLVALILPAFAYGVINFASHYLFVPLISRLRTQYENDEATVWAKLWPNINLAVLVSAGIVIAVIVVSPIVMRIWSGGFPTESFSTIVFYSRLTAAMVLLGTTEAFMRSYLNVRENYSYPAAGFIFFNLISIGAIVLLHNEISVGAVAVGLIGGLLVQNIFLLIRLLGFKPLAAFTFSLSSDDRRALAGMAVVVLLVELVNRSYFMIDRYFAPSFGEGVVASLNYCQVLVQLPDSIIGFAIGAVVFPMFSKSASSDDLSSLAATYHKAIVSAVLIAIPLTLFFVINAEQIVRLVFQRGAFDTDSTAMTASILIPYAPSILALFVVSTSIRACYAGGWGKTVLWFALSALAAKLIGTAWMVTWFGYGGISAATSVSHILMAILLTILIIRRCRASLGRLLAVDLGRLLLAAIPTYFLVFWVSGHFIYDSSGIISTILSLAISAFAIAVTFLILVWVFGMGSVIRSVLIFGRDSSEEKAR